jgi:protease-4
MGNLAASGGYWVSTPADRIFAEPETVTGSIGIFGVLPTFEVGLAKWGVTTDGVRTTPFSGQPDLFAGLTPETEEILQATIESGYERFLGLVAQSRRITRDRADEIGQGRVWDGGTARQIGLVDQFGGLDDALAYAAKQARLGDGQWHAEFLGADTDPYAPILRRLWRTDDGETRGSDMFALFARRESAQAARVLAGLDGLLSVRGAQARCLECPLSSAAPRATTTATARGSLLQFVVSLVGD